MGVRRVELAQSLRELGVDDAVLEKVRVYADRYDVPLRHAATKVEGVQPRAIAAALSRLSGLPVMEVIDHDAIEPELIRPLPLNLAREYGVLPLYVSGDELIVGMADLSSMTALDDLRVLHGYPVRPVIVPADVLEDATNKAY